jgi:hypothetical protein
MLLPLARTILAWSEFERHVDFVMAEDVFVDAKPKFDRQPRQEPRRLLARFIQSQSSLAGFRKAWLNVFVLIFWRLRTGELAIL